MPLDRAVKMFKACDLMGSPSISSLKASAVIPQRAPPSSSLIALAFDASTMAVPSSKTAYSSAPSMEPGEFCSLCHFLSLLGLLLRRAPSLLNRKGGILMLTNAKERACKQQLLFLFYVRGFHY